MRSKARLVLVILALTTAGCASGTAASWSGGNGLASPSPTIPDCRNQGTYNRAANLCVSGGGP
jgi:hypothetical protein